MDSSSQQDNLISAAARDGLYRTLFFRRDVQIGSDSVEFCGLCEDCFFGS